jgi:hypothetical protein
VADLLAAVGDDVDVPERRGTPLHDLIQLLWWDGDDGRPTDYGVRLLSITMPGSWPELRQVLDRAVRTGELYRDPPTEEHPW